MKKLIILLFALLGAITSLQGQSREDLLAKYGQSKYLKKAWKAAGSEWNRPDGAYPKTIKYYSKEIEVHPGNLLAYEGLTFHLCLRESFSEAVEVATKGITLAEPNTQYYYNLLFQRAKAYSGLKEYENALPDMLACLDETSHLHLSRLGKIYLGLGNLEKAKESYEKAIAIDPTEGWDYAHLSEVYQALGQPEKAKEAMDLAIKYGYP